MSTDSMNRRRRASLHAAATLTIVLTTGGCTAAGTPTAAGALPEPLDTSHAARIARIESSLLPATRVRGRDYRAETIEARLAALGVPALSVAVIEGGEIAWARAYGVADASTGAVATTETLFQAASMSKPVAAMGALALVQDGRLTLDDDVNRWLRRWRVPEHEWSGESAVTLRRLLSHTAGLTVHGFPGYGATSPVPSVEQVLAGAAPANTEAVRVSTRPGAEYRYSGGGTTVVQLLIEEVAGVPFPRYMRDRVLEPTGMTWSTYEQPLPGALAARAATAHRARAQPIVGRYHTYPEMAAAGLWTTPTDLARWILTVQSSLAGDTTGVLHPWMARTMVTGEPLRHGLGPQIDTISFYHGGANAGFRGVFVGFLERGSGAVIMTNADAGGTIGSELLLAIAAEYGWPGMAPVEIVPVPIAAAQLRGYEGRYGTSDQPIQVTVAAAGESLMMTTPDGARHEFVFAGEDRFRPASGGSEATFERATDGTVTALRIAGLRLPREGAGAPSPAAPEPPVGPTTAPAVDPGAAAAQRAFFENLRRLCGRTFGGRTILAPATDRTFEPARLYMVVDRCEGDEIRVPFIVGDDDSRTWVFRMRDDRLTFFHEHLRPDGTEHDVSGFGGHASDDGSATFQSFPDFWATEDTPPAEHRVWRLRMDHANDLFVYYLDRGGEPAYRLVFYMGPPSPPLDP